MCARMSMVASSDRIEDVFEVVDPPRLDKTWNIAPTDDLLAIVGVDGARAATRLRWGLIPFWAKSAREGVKMINARAETVRTKQPFKASFPQRRALIVADGFYEWQTRGKLKLPFHFRLASGEPLALAGLWGWWRPPEGPELHSATVITTTPNPLLARIHDRMPVILPKSAWSAWLDPATDPDVAASFLAPFPADQMIAVPVSTHVNAVRNDDPECHAPGEHTLPEA